MAACSAQIGSISVTTTRAPWPRERVGAALAHVAEAADHGDLAADEHVGGPVDPVDERVAAAVLVVELGLGHRVVDVDGREEELAARLHLDEPVHAGGGLLGDALDAVGDRGPAARRPRPGCGSSTPSTTANSSESAVDGSGTAPAFSNSTPLWTSRVASPPSSRIRLGPSPPGHRRACSVHHQYSSRVSPFQAKTGTPLGSSDGAVGADGHGGRGVVLGGEDVAAGPAHLGAEGGEGLDEHGGLDGHVERAGDAGAGQGLGGAELGAHGHEAGHLVLGQHDLLAAVLGQGEVGDLEVVGACFARHVAPSSYRPGRGGARRSGPSGPSVCVRPLPRPWPQVPESLPR